MTTQLEAIYEQGVLRPLQPLDLAEGVKVEIILVSPLKKRTPYEILSAIATLPLEVEPPSAKLAAMHDAMNDPLFLADLEEIAEDFQYVDAEGSVE
ncbi:MAG: antitoxin family protein [Blastocatellia bacterium]